MPKNNYILYAICILLLFGCTPNSNMPDKKNNPRSSLTPSNQLKNTLRMQAQLKTVISDYNLGASISQNQMAFNQNTSLLTMVDAINELIIDIHLNQDMENSFLDAIITTNSGGYENNHRLLINNDGSIVVDLNSNQDYLTIPKTNTNDNLSIRRSIMLIQNVILNGFSQSIKDEQWSLAYNQTIDFKKEKLNLTVLSASLAHDDFYDLIEHILLIYGRHKDVTDVLRNNIVKQAQIDGHKLTDDELTKAVDDNLDALHNGIDFIKDLVTVNSLDITLGINEQQHLVYKSYRLNAVYHPNVDTSDSKTADENIAFTLYLNAKHSAFNQPYLSKSATLTNENSQTLESRISEMFFKLPKYHKSKP